MSDDETREPELDRAQEAAISHLLGALPDPTLPGDVRQRIAAAVGAEAANAANVPAPTPEVAVNAPVPPSSDPTRAVLSGGAPSGGWRRPWMLQTAAIIVIIALVGAVAAGFGLSRGGSNNDASTDPLVRSQETAGPITSSGRAYNASTLAGQVRGLVAGAGAGPTEDTATGQSLGFSATAGGGTTAGDAKEFAAAKALINDPTTRQACIDQLASVPGAQPVAIDVGVFEGKPAAVVVLPDEADPTKVAAWVVGPTCSTKDNPFPYRFERVTRP